MPPADSSALIVARYLKANHYFESYDAFIAEAGLPVNAGDVSKGDLTLETLLEEKKTFDVSLRFEKLGTEDALTGWTEPSPKEEHAVASLPSRSNLLSTSVETFVDGHVSKSILLATSADRRLHVLGVPDCTLEASLIGFQDAPILSCAVILERILLTTSMSGQLVASDLHGNRRDSRRDHSKYVVKVVVFSGQNDELLLATAGWDSKIIIYKPTTDPDNFHFNEPISIINLQTKPESLLFLSHPQTSDPILLISRTDASHIFYYTIESTPRLLGKQNLAPHSNAWVAFTPSSLALCPTDPTLLAVGTNSVPNMKLLLLRLLIPAYHPPPANTNPAVSLRTSLLDDNPEPRETQASQARAALAIADREAAAILIHANTLAPQTPYSNPTVVWRPDGSGVWVNGDDGVVRGVEARTGKIVRSLTGHEEGSKVRCLWAGRVHTRSGEGIVDGEDEMGEEWLVSGGFDQQLIVWKPGTV